MRVGLVRDHSPGSAPRPSTAGAVVGLVVDSIRAITGATREHDPAGEVGVVEGDRHGHTAAHAVADEVGGGEPEVAVSSATSAIAS
jgi:hypothetical protein